MLGFRPKLSSSLYRNAVMPQITIDFYRTETQEGAEIDISQTITQCHLMPINQRRIDLELSSLFLHNVQTSTEGLIGEVVRDHMYNLPNKINRQTGAEADLDLAEDEGLAERAHFLYNQATRTLLLQRRQQVRPAGFRECIAIPTRRDFVLVPMLREGALPRLQRMQIIKKVVVKIARPGNVQNFRGIDTSASRMIDMLNDFGGLYGEFTFSVGKSNDGLERNRVLQAIRRLFRYGDRNEVKKIVVSGRETQDGATEMLDLFQDRLTHQDEVRLAGRRLDPGGCNQALRRAYLRYANYLREYGRQE